MSAIVTMTMALPGCAKEAESVNPKPPLTLAATPADGTIVSKRLVQVKGQSPTVNIYQIFYISAGQKAEAFLSEPKADGKYQLLVNLHGGFAGPNPSISHYNFGYQADSLQYASDSSVIVEPEYRGYMDSSGTVQGLSGDTIDTENALKAAMSFGNISPDSIYLLGYSMGGGVALRVASERHDVDAVVAVSPFVGWDEIIHWMSAHPNENSSSTIIQERKLADQWSAYFSQNPTNERQNSLLDRIPEIQAPVLFLQGTGDQNVVWQTVQEYEEDMQKAHKIVKMVLYPGGAHGLHDKYENASNEQLINWFNKYGLSDPWG